MARPLRVLFPGAWYHVMNRGLEHRAIFRSSRDSTRFLDLLREASERFSAEFHAYCLMGNHYHLLLRTPEPNLPDTMRFIDGVYTQWFNRECERDGPLLRGRYRSVLVQADGHLLAASRYVHLNPVEAGMARFPEEWRFSSYRAYLDPGLAQPWLRTRFVLERFGPIGARARYREYVESGLDPETRAFYEASRQQPVLGTTTYRDEIAAVLGDAQARLPDYPEARRLRSRPSLTSIAGAVGRAFDMSPARLPIDPTKRGEKTAIARGAFLDLALRVGHYRMRDACAWLGYRAPSSGSTARRRFLKACDSSSETAENARRAATILQGVAESGRTEKT